MAKWGGCGLAWFRAVWLSCRCWRSNCLSNCRSPIPLARIAAASQPASQGVAPDKVGVRMTRADLDSGARATWPYSGHSHHLALVGIFWAVKPHRSLLRLKSMIWSMRLVCIWKLYVLNNSEWALEVRGSQESSSWCQLEGSLIKIMNCGIFGDYWLI